MADETEKQVTQNTIDIGVLKSTSAETLLGVNKLCETMDKDREQNRKSFDIVDKLLRGKDAENPGLIVRVVLLESFAKRAKGAIASTITAVIAMGAAILSWILGGFGTKGN